VTGPADCCGADVASWGWGSLRQRVEVACQDATGLLLNAEHGAGLEPLAWRVVTEPSGWVRSLIGQVPSVGDDRARAALLAWADRHHLVPAADPLPGTGEVHGRIAGLPIQIWAVIDRATFEQEPTQNGATS
jgi:hypothetical protein